VHSGQSIKDKEFTKSKLISNNTLIITNYIFPPHLDLTSTITKTFIFPGYSNKGAMTVSPLDTGDKYQTLCNFAVRLNLVVARLINQSECNCSTMNATEEWQFLCAAHNKATSCDAMSYTKHTLDHSILFLLDFKPSEKNNKQLASIARRFYRIFAHIFYHHREFFDDFELETSGTCREFVAFLDGLNLTNEDSKLIPRDALGL
jgi:Mob1/phocein family